jgi:hypothetical protein
VKADTPTPETPPAGPEAPSQPDTHPEIDTESTTLDDPEPAPTTPPPAAPERIGNIILEEDSTYLITLILKNRGDTMRDKLRLRQVYGTLISYPGQDRFAFQIIENDQAHLLEFPNASTKASKALIKQLRDMLGRENVQVEKYLF